MIKSIYTFARAQVSAFLGGVTDYAFMISLTELAGLHYTYSILISGVIGAIFNFSINRYWAFRADGATKSPLGFQLIKFALVVAGSILLKSSGTYLITNVFKTDYRISRVMIDLLVSYGFNYVLIKNWVFKKNEERLVAD